jgi:hypothetical protein
MNERIKELAIKAGWSEDIRYAPRAKEIEKFAELIVRECIDCLKPLSRNHSMVGAARDTIKEHFGVE